MLNDLLSTKRMTISRCALCDEKGEKMRDDDEKEEKGWDVVDDLARTRSCKFALLAWSFCICKLVFMWYSIWFAVGNKYSVDAVVANTCIGTGSYSLRI